MKPKVLLFLLLIILLSGVSGCSTDSSASGSITGFYFDTVISISIYDKIPSSSKKELLNGCMDLASEYEGLFSRTKEGSDIWNINHSGGKAVTVDEATAKLLTTALSYASLSEGQVDPSIGALSSLWNFGSGNQKIIPSKKDIKNALSHVNYKNIIIEKNQVTLKDPLACLDLGFIAKGFIADKMKEYLTEKGVKSALINLGGNVLTIGAHLDGSPFKIGIQNPLETSGTPLLSLEVSGKSVVSSGNYERCFEMDGVLYHHILSAATGFPVNNELSQVTVISDFSTDGDALSTLCFILGLEKGQALINSLAHTEAVFVTKDGQIYKTYDTLTVPASTLL